MTIAQAYCWSLVAIITLYFVTIYISSGLVGGFLAVSRTDVFQSLLMLASFTIIPAMLLHVTDYSVAGMVENGLLKKSGLKRDMRAA